MADKTRDPKPAAASPHPESQIPRFKPSCTHPTMARLYDPHLTCYLCDAIAKGHPVGFDLLGAEAAKHLTVRPRSPESRAKKLSFFGEVTAEQLKTYTPDQIRKILEQREHILDVAARSSSSTLPPPGFDHLKSTKPWVPSESEECQFKCCPRCRPSAETRSYLSLDGIVKGDIPPTAAVAFDFHRIGRDVIHPDRIKYIGLTAVPWPRAAAKSVSSESSVSSLSSLSSLHCSSLGIEETGESTRADLPESLSSQDSLATESIATEEHSLCDIPQPPWPHIPDSSKENIRSVLFSACVTSLPAPTPEEQANLGQFSTKTKEEEMKEEQPHKKLLEVVHGVTFLEESVKFGVPDIVTQV
ncbi:hypothetical protein M434DRAFT_32379 [Hypoxylon sp. CO27-5]|nr:hypothetical protein M434DRAFT_32379 [Hypoxylon sp. CO27-5]